MAIPQNFGKAFLRPRMNQMKLGATILLLMAAIVQWKQFSNGMEKIKTIGDQTLSTFYMNLTGSTDTTENALIAHPHPAVDRREHKEATPLSNLSLSKVSGSLRQANSVINSLIPPTTPSGKKEKEESNPFSSWQSPKSTRYYGTHPVTAEESAVLTARQQSESTRTFRMAVCHPTIHSETTRGNLTSMEKFLVFVSYYRLLGFDHIFLWYLPGIQYIDGFDTLQALPYVTITEHDPSLSQQKETYFGQGKVMAACLREEQYAHSYDWVLSIDADEYLWLNPQFSNQTASPQSGTTTNSSERPMLNVKDWLTSNGFDRYHYLSFGKYMYTMKHVYLPASSATPATDTQHKRQGKMFGSSSSFGEMSLCSFTGGPYCHKEWISQSLNYSLATSEKQRRGTRAICPGWRGRSKVMVKPKFWSNAGMVILHGDRDLLVQPGAIHFHPFYQAHIKEWGNWLHPFKDPTIRADTTSFFITRQEEVETHEPMESHVRYRLSRPHKGGNDYTSRYYDAVLFFWDQSLVPWLQSVAQGFPDSHHFASFTVNNMTRRDKSITQNGLSEFVDLNSSMLSAPGTENATEVEEIVPLCATRFSCTRLAHQNLKLPPPVINAAFPAKVTARLRSEPDKEE